MSLWQQIQICLNKLAVETSLGPGCSLHLVVKFFARASTCWIRSACSWAWGFWVEHLTWKKAIQSSFSGKSALLLTKQQSWAGIWPLPGAFSRCASSAPTGPWDLCCIQSESDRKRHQESAFSNLSGTSLYSTSVSLTAQWSRKRSKRKMQCCCLLTLRLRDDVAKLPITSYK